MRGSDEALVLRRTPFRETSLVVHLLTRHSGPLSLVARGVRRTGRGERAALAGFHTLAIEHRSRSENAMGTLTRVETVRSRRQLTENGSALMAAQLVQETVYRFSLPGDPQPRLFQRLEWAFDALDAGLDPLSVTSIHLGNLVRDLGYGWRADRCVRCNREEALVWFSVRRGQVVCDPCGTPHAPLLIGLPEKVLKTMQRLEWSPDFGLLSQQEKQVLYRIGIATLAHLGGRPLVSDRSFQQLAGLTYGPRYQNAGENLHD